MPVSSLESQVKASSPQHICCQIVFTAEKTRETHRRRQSAWHVSPPGYARTFVAIKPDGVQRQLVGEIIRRFERKGFRLLGLKLLQASEELLKEHYVALRDRPFYGRLVKYMSSGPVVAMVWQGLDVVRMARMMIGETNPAESLPGTIRGDFCIDVGRNVIHGSDSVESARQEISLWFRPEELTCWEDAAEHWIYE
uniref:Nucleoside diphosphate kinase n=1 Tax=Anser brachyrhynchus TaxID=132585 RepID=A0A8B9BA39_9AVES